MQKLKGKEKGITLIALVVTIIVLLILAAIAINLTIGDNGLVTRAKIAAEKSKEETAKEEVKIAWTSITTDYIFDSSVKENVEKGDYYTKENLNEELKATGEITEFEYVEGGITTLTYVKPNKENPKEKYYMEMEDLEIRIIKKVPIQEGTIEFGNSTWENQKATIELKTTSGHKIQYQINKTLDDGWTEGNRVSELNLDDIVYARLWNGKEEYGEPVSKKITEDKVPNKGKITFSTTSTNTISKITAKVEQTDNESGVQIESCKWQYDTSSEDIGTEAEKYTGTFTEVTQDITLKATVEGTYYLHVLTVDKAGNVQQTTSDIGVTVEHAVAPGNPDPTTGIFQENSTVNGEDSTASNPEVPKGFKPVNEGGAVWDTEDGYKSGLIIQDAEGNQYVWVAVDGEKVKLSRYNFAASAAAVGDGRIRYGEGTRNWGVYEFQTSQAGVASARDLAEFKNSVNEHGGYYIGRYEAGAGATSRVRRIPNKYISVCCFKCMQK